MLPNAKLIYLSVRRGGEVLVWFSPMNGGSCLGRKTGVKPHLSIKSIREMVDGDVQGTIITILYKRPYDKTFNDMMWQWYIYWRLSFSFFLFAFRLFLCFLSIYLIKLNFFVRSFYWYNEYASNSFYFTNCFCILVNKTIHTLTYSISFNTHANCNFYWSSHRYYNKLFQVIYNK